MHYTHIVFDVDGTLVDTEYAVLHSLQDTIGTLTGQKPPLEELTFALGITGEDALKRLAVSDIPGTLALWIDYLRQYDDTTALFQGMEETLSALSQKAVGWASLHRESGTSSKKNLNGFPSVIISTPSSVRMIPKNTNRPRRLF